MRQLNYQVPKECDGMEVKTFLRRHLGISTRALITQKQTEKGLLKNGEFCKANEALHAGDRLTLSLPEEKGEYEPEECALTVVYEDEDYLVVDKPANMPIHPSPGHNKDSLLNAVAFYQRQREESYRIRPLYRLDKDTSGLVVLGKHRIAASCGQSEKVYLAVCQGELSGEGRIDAPIGLEDGSKIKRECGHGQPAVTHWKAIKQGENHTLLALTLETGRTHQIRAHMAHIGHPLAGDDLYGGSREKIPRQALHCGYLRLRCKALGLFIEEEAPLPKDFIKAFPWLKEVDLPNKEVLLCPPV